MIERAAMPDSDNNDNGNRRALIVGGSMAGMFAALLLRRHGWRGDVFERSGEAMASRGAGLATHPELADALTAAGIPGRRSGPFSTGTPQWRLRCSSNST